MALAAPWERWRPRRLEPLTAMGGALVRFLPILQLVLQLFHPPIRAIVLCSCRGAEEQTSRVGRVGAPVTELWELAGTGRRANTKARPGRPEGGEVMGLRAVYRYLRGRFGG